MKADSEGRELFYRPLQTTDHPTAIAPQLLLLSPSLLYLYAMASASLLHLSLFQLVSTFHLQQFVVNLSVARSLLTSVACSLSGSCRAPRPRLMRLRKLSNPFSRSQVMSSSSFYLNFSFAAVCCKCFRGTLAFDFGDSAL